MIEAALLNIQISVLILAGQVVPNIDNGTVPLVFIKSDNY